MSTLGQPMSGDQEIRNLWSVIDDIKNGQSQMLAELSGIRSLLGERCEARLQTMESLARRIKDLEDKYHVLDKTVLKVSVITGLITAILSSAATGLVIRFIGGFAK